MTDDPKMLSELDSVADDAITELARRVQDINNSYRAVARKMGQLYMCADANRVASMAQALDKPMRNASDNEMAFASLLADLRMIALQRR